MLKKCINLLLNVKIKLDLKTKSDDNNFYKNNNRK